MLRKTAIALVLLMAAARPSTAADSAAFLTRLFIDVCVPNLGQPAKVRKWAEVHHLEKMQNPIALGVLVGPGDNGAAWAIPAAEGSFALSIRGMTQACAVWAQNADPRQVLTNFKMMIEGVKRLGIDPTVDKDEVSPSPIGEAHALVYKVPAPNASMGFEFMMLTAERPGGAFQASIQAAKTAAHQPTPK